MNLFYDYGLHYIVRMVVACVCGIIIGFERKNRAKEAGIRTHCIVCLASALMMIISKYAFYDLLNDEALNNVDVRLDPSRMAQGIVTGVGFLGAGMIYVHKQTVKGLTTAAGIWSTCGIGMAIGSGMYFLGISATVIMLIVQTLLHVNAKWLKSPKHKKLVVYNVDRIEFQIYAERLMAERNISVEEINVIFNHENNTADFEFTIELPPQMHEIDVCKMFEYSSTLRQL